MSGLGHLDKYMKIKDLFVCIHSHKYLICLYCVCNHIEVYYVGVDCDQCGVYCVIDCQVGHHMKKLDGDYHVLYSHYCPMGVVNVCTVFAYD